MIVGMDRRRFFSRLLGAVAALPAAVGLARVVSKPIDPVEWARAARGHRPRVKIGSTITVKKPARFVMVKPPPFFVDPRTCRPPRFVFVDSQTGAIEWRKFPAPPV